MLDTRETKWPATHHTGVGMLQVEEIALEARETTQGPRTDTCFVPTTLTGELELVLALLSHQPVTWLVRDHSGVGECSPTEVELRLDFIMHTLEFTQDSSYELLTWGRSDVTDLDVLNHVRT